MTRYYARFECMERALQLLEEVGPQTRTEICAELGLCESAGIKLVRRLHRGHCIIHISGWIYELGDGGRRYPRARYAFGPGKDRPKPPIDRKAIYKRYRERCKMRVTSVFDLGLPIKQRPRCRSI